MERRLGRSCETAAGVVGRLNLTMCDWLVWDVSSVERGVVVEPLDVSGRDVGMMKFVMGVLGESEDEAGLEDCGCTGIGRTVGNISG